MATALSTRWDPRSAPAETSRTNRVLARALGQRTGAALGSDAYLAAEGESLAAGALGAAADVMMAHPLALQLRNLQSLVEIGVDKNTMVVFPAPLMSTVQELGAFLAREAAAVTAPVTAGAPMPSPRFNGEGEPAARP
jgi:hypothetical protein